MEMANEWSKKMWYKLLIVLAFTIIVCQAVTFVNKTETATMTFQIISTSDSVKAPFGTIIVEKLNDKCSLKASSTKYKLVSTSCQTYLKLNILDTKDADAGDYVCSASDCTERLIILGQPTTPSISISTNLLKTGEDITLTCSSQSTTKPEENALGMGYTWFLNGMEISEIGSSLVINDVSESMFNNSYTCLAREYTGPSSIQSDPYLLKVKYWKKLQLTINGNVSNQQDFVVDTQIIVECKIDAYPQMSYVGLQKDNQFIKISDGGNSLSYNKSLTCDDNVVFSCFGMQQGKGIYSPKITVKIPCPPVYASSVKEPVVLNDVPAVNKTFDIKIIGEPKPAFSVMKVTENGLVPLPVNYEIQTLTIGFRLYFRNFNEVTYGIYQIKAENVLGIFKTNITITGITKTPTNLIAWSTSPNSVILSWDGRDNFGQETRYTPYYKEEGKLWTASSNINDVGRKIYFTVNNLQIETRYHFMIQAYTSNYGTSFYSNVATAVTIKQGGEPQTPPSGNTEISTEPHTTTKPPTESTSQDAPDCSTDMPKQDPFSFKVGVGIGLSVGIVIAVVAIIVTVVVLRRSAGKDKKTDDIRVEQEPHIDGDIDRDNLYENLETEMYEQLGHSTSGVHYNNAGYNRT